MSELAQEIGLLPSEVGMGEVSRGVCEFVSAWYVGECEVRGEDIESVYIHVYVVSVLWCV